MIRFNYKCAVALIVAILSSNLFSACAKKLFPELSGRSDVESVYISPMVMKMAGASYLDPEKYGEEAAQMLSEIRSLHVYECDSQESVSLGMKALEKYIKEHPGYEEMLSTEEDDEVSIIYGRPSGKGDGKCDSLLIVAREGDDELSIVFINAD